jgi:hypothetical protein
MNFQNIQCGKTITYDKGDWAIIDDFHDFNLHINQHLLLITLNS